MKRNILKVTLLALVLAAGFVTASAALATDNPGASHEKVTICHAVNGEGETGDGYNVITVNFNSIADAQSVGGHGDHDGDIIPPYTYTDPQGTVNYPGKGDQSILENGCKNSTEPGDVLLPTGVTFHEATCDTGPSFTLVKTFIPGLGLRPFYNVEGEFVDGKPVAGQTYTLTAIPVEGYTFGDQQTTFTHTFAAAPTSCGKPPCPDGLPPEANPVDPNDNCKRPVVTTTTTTTTTQPPTTTTTTTAPAPTPPVTTTTQTTTPAPAAKPPKTKTTKAKPPVVTKKKLTTELNKQAPKSPTAEKQTAGELPNTGLPLGVVAFFGFSTLLSGLWMRGDLSKLYGRLRRMG